MPAIDVRTVTGFNETWSHVFQGANTTWLSAFNQSIRIGNFFNGLQGMAQLMFDAQIPPGSIIDTATVELEANNTKAGALTVPLKTIDRDTYYSEPLIQPFVPFNGYRRDYWSNAAMGALSTTFTAIAGSATSPSNASWIMKQIGTWREKMWQLTPTRTGNMEISFCIWEMHRTGNPLGSCRMRIQGVQLDKYGQKQPDGIDVGVSDDVLCSSIALGPAADTVAFFFTTDPTTLVAETEYFWCIEVDYTADNANHVSTHHDNRFFNNGQLYHEGSGRGFDWQNYPGTVDLSLGAAAQATVLAGPINWAMPNFVANTRYTSPDITALVQAQVNAPWYTQDAGILICFPAPNSGAIWRIWKSPFFGAADQSRLQATYHDRRIMVT